MSEKQANDILTIADM